LLNQSLVFQAFESVAQQKSSFPVLASWTLILALVFVISAHRQAVARTLPTKAADSIGSTAYQNRAGEKNLQAFWPPARERKEEPAARE